MTLFRRLQGNNRGVTAVEFALIAPVFFAFLLGFIDLGRWIYVRAIAIGALEDVTRSSGVGGATVDPRTFEERTEELILKSAKDATFQWTKRSYHQFSAIGKPEKLITDNNGNGSYDGGDCWEDSNPNGNYDQESGQSGIGGADDILLYEVKVSFDPIVPTTGFLSGLDGRHHTTVETMVRRQPFAAQIMPSVRCG